METAERDPAPPEVLLTWRVHLAARHPRKAIGCVGLIGLMVLCGHLIFRSPGLTLAGALMLLGSVSDFLFPVRYTLTTQGAEMRSWISGPSIAWARVRRYYVDEEGVKLSPLPRPSRLEAYRGVYLRFEHNREEVLRIVQERTTELSG